MGKFLSKGACFGIKVSIRYFWYLCYLFLCSQNDLPVILYMIYYLNFKFFYEAAAILAPNLNGRLNTRQKKFYMTLTDVILSVFWKVNCPWVNNRYAIQKYSRLIRRCPFYSRVRQERLKGVGVGEWSARRARNPMVTGSSPALAACWICSWYVPSSNPRPCLEIANWLSPTSWGL